MGRLESWERVQCKMSADAFAAAYESGYDMYDVYERALTSFEGSITYSPIQCGVWCGGTYVLSIWEDGYEFKKSDVEWDINAVRWVGYMLRYWVHYRPQDSSQDIYDTVAWDDWMQCYVGFHCIAPELAIDNFMELKALQRVNK